MGRLTKDPEVRYTQGSDPKCVARFTLAVDRRFKKDEADFIQCAAWGKTGEFAEKYLKKGTKVALSGRIQTGSYTKQDGTKVYTTEVIAEQLEFTETKKDAPAAKPAQSAPQQSGGFMAIPDDIREELPFA